MIEDVTLDVELDKRVCHGLGVREQNQEYEMEMEFSIEDDDMVEALAKATGTPIVYVSTEDGPWEKKPFVPVDP